PSGARAGPVVAGDLRVRARQAFAAFLAKRCAGDLVIESGSNQPIRLLRATPIACTGLRARTIGELAERVDLGRSLKDARYANDNDAHAPGLVGVGFGLRFFGGGADFAYNLFGSALNPADPGL